jgi:uncharacterized membrane protein YccC
VSADEPTPAARSLRPLPPLGRALTEVRAAATLAPARPAYAAGFRAAIATVAPLAVDHALGLGGGTWMSLAGFSGALADKGGPYRTRAATLGVLTAGAASAATAAALVSSRPYLAVLLALLIAVLTSLGRAYGNAGASVGIGVLNVFVISLGYPSATPRDAVIRGAFVVAGGLWAMLVALVLWPLRPYRPVRLAVGAAYRAVADYADEVARSARERTAPGPLRVRAALEAARAALASVRRGRPGESGRGERLVVLGEVADQLFGQLFGLSDVIDTLPLEPRLQPAREALAATAAAAAETLRAIAEATEEERGTIPVALGWGGDTVRATLADEAASSHPPIPDEDRRHGQAAADLLDRAAQYAGVAAATVAGLNDGRSVPPLTRPLEVEDPEPPVPWWGPIRAAIAPRSMILRFALRVGLVTAIAVGLTAVLGLRRGYWVTVTAVIILQPYTGATTQRALQRVLGTIVGGALTAALAALFHDPLAILLLAFVFSGVSVALLPLNYAAFSVFLTPTFVLLAEASAGDWHLAGVRIANTLIGGALALAGSRLLWPSPEADRVPVYLADMVRAMGRYFDEAIARFGDRGDAAGRALRAARRGAGLAILNADESFQRLLGEHRGPAEALAPAMTLLTYARRFTASIAALVLSRHMVQGIRADQLAGFAGSVRPALAELASALAEGRAPLPLEEIPTLDGPNVSPLLQGRATRLARQLKTLHDAAARWLGGVPADTG